ncbi:MAG: ExeM/NucH family extracellular endonuclease, partial [Naasia sp.]
MAHDAAPTTPGLTATPSQNRRNRLRLAAVTASAATLLAAVGMVPTAAQAAVSSDAPVVIGEIYGGGGNSGAALTTDFVELVNTGDSTIDLGGWSLQYASATGTSWTVDTLAGSIAPGGTFLVAQARGNGGSVELPAIDDAGTLALSGTSGKLALASTPDRLTAATGVPTDAAIVDYVAWGPTATPFAGSGPAPASSNTTSIARIPGADGEIPHTADNARDFLAGAPTPFSSTTTTPEEPEPEPTTSPEPTTPPTTPPAPALTIAEIQGTGAATAYDGQVVTTEGVVTAHYPTGGLSGYVIQTGGTGGALAADRTASDAIFVYAPGVLAGEVALGDTVRITAEADEFNGLTQLRAAAGGVAKIAAATAPVPATVGWPTDDAGREALESMLIQPQGDFTVTNTFSTNQYGEVGLASGSIPLRQPTQYAEPGSDAAASIAADNAARSVTLDDGATTNFLTAANAGLTPAYVSQVEPVRVAAAVEFSAPVIVDYRFDLWRFQPQQALLADGSGADGVVFENTRTAAPETVGGDVTVGSFNVLNYFTTLGTDTSTCQAFASPNDGPVTVRGGCDQRGAWDSADFARQQAKLVEAINSLDASVVGLSEIENSAALGEEPDEALAGIVDALNADAGSAKWAYVPSSADLPPAAELDVITNAIIYQPALVRTAGEARALGTESDDGEAFGNAREPIAQRFEPAGGGDEFLFVINH